jgi:hypothetical protein
MADFLRAQEVVKTSGGRLIDKAVIFIWLPGGPPHMETYDMKPDAPREYRGIFQPIHTNVSGMDVCELLPMHAKCADKYTLIRSVHHDFSDHGGGHKRFLTGRIPATPTGFVNDAPSVLSIINKSLSHKDQAMPACVAGVDRGRDGIDVFSFGSAYLGPATTPFIVSGDPSSPKFEVKNIGLAPELEHQDVLLIATGEFGRTPKLSEVVGSQTGMLQPGRDHWPNAMSMLVTGGGMQTGQIIGATNARGEYPVERPLSPNDLWATVYKYLGINYEASFLDHQGRPMPILPFGEPIPELLA